MDNELKKKYGYLIDLWEKDKIIINIDEKQKIDKCFSMYKIKIEENKLTLEEYTNRINNSSECDYLCTFIENKSSNLYGSASAGSATYFGIKKNDDESTYYISKKIDGEKEQKNATLDDAQNKFSCILDNLKKLVEQEITDDNKETIFNAVEKDNKITSRVMLRKIVAMNNHESFLYAYSDESIDIIYEFFVNDKAKTNIDKNYEATKAIKGIFTNKPENDESTYMIRLSKFIWSIFGSTIQLEAKNMVLHGAPGTGKTYSIKNTIKNIILKQGGDIAEQLIFTQFHPSYSYEDFIDGIKPVGIDGDSGQMKFELKNGQFKELCRIATIKLKKERKEKRSDGELTKYFFVADEINRAELSRVFGELLVCLEDDYRIDFDTDGEILKEENLIITQNASLDNNPVYAQNGKNYFGVPINISFIGTMNDIDRSIDSFDMALRRRFFWKEVRCNYDFIYSLYNHLDYTKICKNLNRYITGYKENNRLIIIDKIGKYYALGLGTSFELGHAYFRINGVSPKNINKLWNSKIEPLLKEYLRAEYSQNEIGKKLEEAKEIFTLPKKRR